MISVKEKVILTSKHLIAAGEEIRLRSRSVISEIRKNVDERVRAMAWKSHARQIKIGEVICGPNLSSGHSNIHKKYRTFIRGLIRCKIRLLKCGSRMQFTTLNCRDPFHFALVAAFCAFCRPFFVRFQKP